MTWQLAAYALLALVLGGGLAWYERSRPPARMVALVAALAALAVAGRLAFAPIPNVVATTDIVLITGYAVGAAPGFAVGALAAVVSNLWLGQGPWTPWQMAGWGLVGLGGAALAVATRRRLGRGGLAAACGLAGLAYGALLDLSVMVTYGGEQSLDRYLALSARGVPFNVAHAVGNIALALAAGPALVRMISRYRSRFEFSWRQAPARSKRRAVPGDGRASARGVASALVALALAGSLGLAVQARAGGPGSARQWLERAQNPDGGFGASSGSASSAAITGWAVLGLESAGRNPLDIRRAGHSPIGYLRSQAGGLRSTGDLERTILALEGAGVSPRRFGGRDLVAELRRRRSRSGSFEGQVNLTAFGILALRAAGASASALARSAAWLRDAQNGDGGWGFQPQAGQRPGQHRRRAPGPGGGRWARAGRPAAGRPTCGAPSAPTAASRSAEGGPTNSQSTAWAVQGLIAAGANPAAVRTNGRSPFDYLAEPPGGRRPLPLLVVERPDAGLGHRPGAARGQPQGRSRSPRCRARPRAADRRPASRCRRASSGGGGSGSSGSRGTATGPQVASGGGSGEPGGAPRRPERGRRGARVRRAGGSSGRRGRALERSTAASRTTAYVAGGFGVLVAALAGGLLLVPPPASLSSPRPARPAAHWIPLWRWMSTPRFAPGAPTRPSGRTRCRGRSWTSCSTSPAGRRTTT